tara:strand:- start:71 stop:409 length:339 start_codon:yes stop_codon:yes gene_type:complete
MADISRFVQRQVLINSDEKYLDLLNRKRLNFLRYRATPNFQLLNIGSATDPQAIGIRHVWKTGDKYYKLAQKYYGDPTEWWIIAQFNQKPTEGHLKVGDVIIVPTKLAQSPY